MAEWTMSPHPPPPPFQNAPPPLKIYVFLIKKGLLPNVFKEMFFMTNQVHSYNTRIKRDCLNNCQLMYCHKSITDTLDTVQE